MTTTRAILVTTIGYAATTGAFIAEPDADYPFGSIVPADDYDEAEQDWQRVVSRRGHADIGELTLAYYDGSEHVARGQQWDGTCWALVDLAEDGTYELVIQD